MFMNHEDSLIDNSWLAQSFLRPFSLLRFQSLLGWLRTQEQQFAKPPFSLHEEILHRRIFNGEMLFPRMLIPQAENMRSLQHHRRNWRSVPKSLVTSPPISHFRSHMRRCQLRSELSLERAVYPATHAWRTFRCEGSELPEFARGMRVKFLNSRVWVQVFSRNYGMDPDPIHNFFRMFTLIPFLTSMCCV